jgi:hypothetical protein
MCQVCCISDENCNIRVVYVYVCICICNNVPAPFNILSWGLIGFDFFAYLNDLQCAALFAEKT